MRIKIHTSGFTVVHPVGTGSALWITRIGQLRGLRTYKDVLATLEYVTKCNTGSVRIMGHHTGSVVVCRILSTGARL